MMIALVTILKKLATICQRILNNNQCRTFLLSAIAPVYPIGCVAERKKTRIRELGNTRYSVLGTLILEGEKPPPSMRAAS